MTLVNLVPMTAGQYRAYRETSDEQYAKDIAESGAMSYEDAVQKAADDFGRLLPQGLETPGHFLFTGYDGDTEVGMLWLRIEDKADGPHAFGFDFRVLPELRRHGYGRAMMVAAEDFCRGRGVVSIGLSVFGFNRGAQSLYEQMGFEVTATQMRKRL